VCRHLRGSGGRLRTGAARARSTAGVAGQRHRRAVLPVARPSRIRARGGATAAVERRRVRRHAVSRQLTGRCVSPDRPAVVRAGPRPVRGHAVDVPLGTHGGRRNLPVRAADRGEPRRESHGRSRLLSLDGGHRPRLRRPLLDRRRGRTAPDRVSLYRSRARYRATAPRRRCRGRARPVCAGRAGPVPVSVRARARRIRARRPRRGDGGRVTGVATAIARSPSAGSCVGCSSRWD